MWYTGLWVTLACAAVHPLIHLSSSNIQVEVKKKRKVSTVYFIFDGFFALLSVLENLIVGPFTVPVVL